MRHYREAQFLRRQKRSQRVIWNHDVNVKVAMRVRRATSERAKKINCLYVDAVFYRVNQDVEFRSFLRSHKFNSITLCWIFQLKKSIEIFRALHYNIYIQKFLQK